MKQNKVVRFSNAKCGRAALESTDDHLTVERGALVSEEMGDKAGEGRPHGEGYHGLRAKADEHEHKTMDQRSPEQADYPDASNHAAHGASFSYSYMLWNPLLTVVWVLTVLRWTQISVASTSHRYFKDICVKRRCYATKWPATLLTVK